MPRNQVRIESPVNEHRYRLLEGMAHAVALNGYAATTIADIVQAACVSRRTFYEHFSTKSECLIALYEAASLAALNVLRDAIDPQHAWQAQAEKAMAAYLACLSQNPLLMRTLFIEILGLGMEGLAARRRVNRQIADFMLNLINTGHDKGKSGRMLSDDMAMAVVGGINELILQAIEQDRVDQLEELTRPAIDLLLSVTLGHTSRR
jgi:AcrR family transcriptional regulator